MLVYEMALGANEIHVLLKDRRIYGVPCMYPVPEERAWEIRCKCRRGWPITRKDEVMNRFAYPDPGIGMVPLMLVCRLM